MNELTLDGKTYVSSKRAAEITGYAKDYIGQLCREGRVRAQLVGRNWYILESAIREHRFGSKESSQVSNKDEKNNKKHANLAWERPKYVPEAIKMIPITDARDLQGEGDNQPRTIGNIESIQTAWQEWFSNRTKDLPQYGETGREDAEEIEEEKVEETEQLVTIHAVYDSPEPREGKNEEEEEAAEEQIQESGEYEPQSSAKHAIQAALIILIIIIIAITLIGTGILYRFYPQIQSRLSEIDSILGTVSIEK